MNSQQLQSGTVIHGAYSDYRIERVLGQGSFGITYAANVRLKGKLGAIESSAMVAIKEFFLHDVSERNGLRVFSVGDSTLCSDYRRDFLREATDLSGDTYYYKWTDSCFELVARYDKRERKSREQFT